MKAYSEITRKLGSELDIPEIETEDVLEKQKRELHYTYQTSFKGL